MSGGWWFRLDGEFVENGKVMDLSDRAFRLHVAGLCYATRNLTDGILSDRAVKVVCALTAAARRHIVELRDAGLWISTPEGGYEIKDYLLYNPPAEEVKELRDKRREAGRKGGLMSGAARRKQKETDAQALAEANALANGAGNRSKHGTEQEEPKAVTALSDHVRARAGTHSLGIDFSTPVLKEMPA